MDLKFIHNFWRNPDDSNLPDKYLSGEERSKFLLELIQRFGKPEDKILEIGCNVGRNLNYLYTHGFKNLEGVEINKEAVELLGKHYPKLKVKIYNNPIENIIKKLGNYDIIFTMAVLEHIHTDSEWIFPEISKRIKHNGTLITIEDEKGQSFRHFPRNYRNVFEQYMSSIGQVLEISLTKKEGFDNNFVARIFKKYILKP